MMAKSERNLYQKITLNKSVMKNIISLFIWRHKLNVFMACVAFVVLMLVIWSITHPSLAPEPLPAYSYSVQTPEPDVSFISPDFTLKNLDNQKVSLSSFKGHPVILNFWYASCPGCQAEIPLLEKEYQQPSVHGLVVLGVNIADDPNTASLYARKMGMTYPIVLDVGQRVRDQYQIQQAPTSFFINSSGYIQQIFVGPLNQSGLQKNLAQLS